MQTPHDKIRVGSVTIPYSLFLRAWVSPSGEIIKNPLKAQRVAEQLNKDKVAA